LVVVGDDLVMTSGAAALQGETTVSTTGYDVVGHLISSLWEVVNVGVVVSSLHGYYLLLSLQIARLG
jgi:hypothetical protein